MQLFTVLKLVLMFLFSVISVVRYGVVTLLLLCHLAINPALAADNGYQINKGDKLKITVWKEDDLNADVLVLPDGTISFPIVGTVSVAGKTVEELQTLLEEQLEEYIQGPEVLVSLLTVEGNEIYVIGEVARPGPYMMTKNLKVMQVLSMAGGLTPYASRNNIRILRETAEGKSISIPFEYDDIEDGENLDTNILLQSEDTIIVP